MASRGGVSADPADPQGPGDEARDFVKYTLYRLDPGWRRLAPHERERGRAPLLALLEHPPDEIVLRTYSTVGTKAGVEMLLWMISPRLESIQEYHARIAGTPIGAYLDPVHSYLGMGRRSEYVADHAHGGQEGGAARRRPHGLPYLFLYPFVKRREWYSLPFEERRRIMGEHFRVGHKFPKVRIHTGYSFGLDDAEFILAFEAESPAEFLDLVQALRPTEASRFTALETPIFTAVHVEPRRLLELAEGIA
jgi:chlorite dismutase